MLLIVGSGQPDSISSLIGKSYSEEFLYSYKLTLSTTNTPEEYRVPQELQPPAKYTEQSCP